MKLCIFSQFDTPFEWRWHRTTRERILSARPFFPEEDVDSLLSDIREALAEGKLRNGRNLRMFERMAAEYLGVEDTVAFDSDGSALETALRYYEVKGREVMVCTNSFISIPNSVVYAGGKVVFVDIREESLSMDPENLLEKISDRTCGVIVTHIAGFPNPDLQEIITICKDHRLFLIEDATHALGAMRNGQKVGNFGDAAIFAFTPTKVLTTGEGGMIATNDARLIENARQSRYYGAGKGKTNFIDLGRHMILPEISAILGIHQLRRVEEFIAKRNQIAARYNEGFAGVGSVRVVRCRANDRASYYKYPLTLSSGIDRAEFAELLDTGFGVETGTVFYPPCHMQPVYQGLRESVGTRNLQVSERVLSKTIALPMHAAMKDMDARYVVESVSSILSRFQS